MYNRIILIGRLTAEPELRQTQSGASVCSFSIAVQRPFASNGGERQTDFLNIVAWRQNADFVTRFFHKGSMIGVEGRLETRDYTDRNNQQRRAYEVIADRCFFVEGRASAPTGGNAYAGTNAPSYGGNSFAGNNAPAPAAPAFSGNSGNAPANNFGSAPSTYASGDFGDFQELDSDEDLPF
jgi:single-strand DNA-binding protein